ncbi:nitrite/sulfite reductase [Nocardia sp. NBC_00508]|uniref:precorrin-3B synthase n=1 Tax=Nocardia sp. NBC_00508 TaxID=2975992 RepID=UPI002E7FD034|nr:precorrin-3B synthase [Nocardia sp. NBC_00508]WUD65643.1 nitrite/sulfite reductase [Nocardia sp. NBC_00508]
MTRGVPDSCPGVLRLHEAADGPLARIRVPGGRLEPAQVQALAEAARDLADGNIELTSRGNVQLRQVRDAEELTNRLSAVRLLPSHTHERVRNIIASPLSGRVGGLVDVHPLVPALDAGLLAAPRLADLPGRVLFTLDDGRGDVSGLGADIGVHAVRAQEFALLLAGRDSGVRLSTAHAVDVMLAAAHGFLALRGDDAGRWRLHDIEHGADRVVDLLGLSPVTDRLELPVVQSIPIGWLEQEDGLVSLGAGVRLGCLPARTAEFLAAIERPIFVTPWRGLVVTDLEEWAAEQIVRVLAPMGLIFDADSPWLLVSACAGQPGCAKSHTDVRADVSDAVGTGRVLPAAHPIESGAADPAPGPPGPETAARHHVPETPTAATDVSVAGRQHWSGCDRRCGRPRGEITDIVATDKAGYRID